MLIHPTLERLRELGLTAMANAYLELQNARDARRTQPRGLARAAGRSRGDRRSRARIGARLLVGRVGRTKQGAPTLVSHSISVPTEEAVMIHGKPRVPTAGRAPAVSVGTDMILSQAFAPAA
jgi:hypothetical protein